jgi:nitroreductase
MKLIDAIKSRRSIRQFKPDSVKDTDVEQILEAGIWAPSSGGTQPYKFLILKDRKQIDHLYSKVLAKEVKRVASHPSVNRTEQEVREELTPYYQGMQQAPVHILLFYDIQTGADRFTDGNVDKFKSVTPLYQSLRDSLIFTVQNMMLMATALGLGSLYLEAFRRHSLIIDKAIKQRKSLEFFVCIPLGYPDETPDIQARTITDFLLKT